MSEFFNGPSEKELEMHEKVSNIIKEYSEEISLSEVFTVLINVMATLLSTAYIAKRPDNNSASLLNSLISEANGELREAIEYKIHLYEKNEGNTH